MKVIVSEQVSDKTQKMLEALQSAVRDALDTKDKLGQYSVHWDGEKPVLKGNDAPVR
jgi:hypothetical protein